MAKQVIWTNTAKKARREILQYWIHRNGSNAYSKKLSQLIRKKVRLIQSQHYLGKPTDIENVRVSLISHFSLFYKVNNQNIIIVGIWDNRRNPEDLHKNLEL
ncbi:MAG: type II toxin-antitoxin system RelE/ParE family toxin [Ginsengibacter sp.]